MSLQIGAQPTPGASPLFEAELLELTRFLRRPLPELLGGRAFPLVDAEMSWRVRCTLRGPLVPPFAEELVVEAVEPTRTAATSTVLQRALARLVHFHNAELVGSRFEFFERRDEMGHTMPLRPHPTFGLHVEDLGILLEYT